MMNSPMVIVAYLEGERPYHPLCDNRTWFNKKWREFIIFDRDIISTIRGYPYEAPNLETIIIEKLSALAEAAGWPAYEPIKQDRNPIIDGLEVAFTTNMMYNDAQYYKSTYKSSSKPTFHFTHNDTNCFINYSGVAICPVCGEVFEREHEEADVVICENCEDVERCCGCNCRIQDDDEAFDIGGDLWCRDCACECDDCNEAYPNSCMHTVYVRVKFHNSRFSDPEYVDDKWVTLCDSCFEKIAPYVKTCNVSYNNYTEGIWLSAGSNFVDSSLPEPYASNLCRLVIDDWQSCYYDSGVILDLPHIKENQKIS